ARERAREAVDASRTHLLAAVGSARERALRVAEATRPHLEEVAPSVRRSVVTGSDAPILVAL
nr:hypothetical protein [Actinomycetota bacterium]